MICNILCFYILKSLIYSLFWMKLLLVMFHTNVHALFYFFLDFFFFSIFLVRNIIMNYSLQLLQGVSLGVPATSWILLADSQKLSFSTLIMKPISVFWSDKPPRRPSLAQPAWSAKLSRQGRPSLGIDGHDPILKKICIFEILMKNCTKYVSASLFWRKNFKSGHP